MKNRRIILLITSFFFSITACTSTTVVNPPNPSASSSPGPNPSDNSNLNTSIKTKADMIRVTECAYNKTTSETAKNQIKMTLDGMQNFPEAYFTA